MIRKLRILIEKELLNKLKVHLKRGLLTTTLVEIVLNKFYVKNLNSHYIFTYYSVYLKIFIRITRIKYLGKY